jgi:hypothetical protein
MFKYWIYVIENKNLVIVFILNLKVMKSVKIIIINNIYFHFVMNCNAISLLF